MKIKITQVEFGVSIIFAVLALLCLFDPFKSAEIFMYTTAVVVSLSALFLWYQFFKAKSGLNILEAVLATLAAVFFFYFAKKESRIVVYLFSFYMFLYCLIFLVQLILDLKNDSKDKWYNLIQTFVYGAIAVGVFVFRGDDLTIVERAFGLYLGWQAVQIWIEELIINHHHSDRFFAFSHFASLPVVIVAVLPSMVLRIMLINQVKKKPKEFDTRKNDQEVNFRIWIHSGLSGEHVFGHMTFSYKGIMYSYGNYDQAKERFFKSIGPGVLFTVPAEIYVNNCCVYEEDTIFEFGLHINEEEEERLQKVLQNLKKETYPWKCSLEVAMDKDPNTQFTQYEDIYACRLWYRTDCQFRKFYKGEWKTYWMLGTNCSQFASTQLRKIFPKLMHQSFGINTPGEYFELLMEQYADPNSNVITKSWHDGTVPETLFNAPD